MASSLNRPPIITVPFANAGSKNTIPNTTSTSGKASMSEGFPDECMVPLPAGIPPDGKDMNGILNLITQWVRFFIGGGQARWNSALSAAVSGYPVGAVIQLDNGTSAYRNTVNGNTYNPNGANPTANGWQPWAGDVVATDAQLISYVEAVENRNAPVGSIRQVKDASNLAACWGICDGRTITYLGTDHVMPDWRDMFLINKGPVANTIWDGYGSNDAALISHGHTINDPGHHHVTTLEKYNESGGNDNPWGSGDATQPEGAYVFTTADATTGITINNTGSGSGTNANIPRCVAVYYVYKFRPYVYGD